MQCPDGGFKNTCSVIQVDAHWNKANPCGGITENNLSSSSPLWLTEAFSEGGSGPFPPELLQKVLHWDQSTRSHLLYWFLQCLVNTGMFWFGFSSEALNKQLSKEASGGTHWDLWGHVCCNDYNIFYLLLAKLSISCRYLKSSQSGNTAFTKRTW